MATSTIIMLIAAGLAGGLAAGMLIGRWWTRRRDDANRERGEDSVESTSRSQHMEALGILSGSIMHNLNNLMSVVLGQARLARDEVAQDSAAWHSLGQVIQAGEAAAQLSREVDDYHSEDDHSRRPIRLQPVIRSTVKLLRDILPNTVDIEVTLDDSCGSVLASPTQLQQMIMSLSSNAYHAMFRRRGRVGISLSEAVVDEPKDAVPSVLTPGHYVMISVSDNGRGMDVDTLSRVFEPYFSARAPRRGAGLGLTMVSRLLAANDGATVVSSLPGHGSRFDVYFPLIARSMTINGEDADRPQLRLVGNDDDASQSTANDSYEPPTIAPFQPVTPQIVGRSPHVLLVEDDTMVAATVRACLERADIQVTDFDDGARAVAAFAADPGAFDLLLTDQFMGGLDGREVVLEVRRYRPRIPAIIMSGHPDGIRPEELAKLELSGTLAKPFTPTKLLELVSRALSGQHSAFEGKA